MNRSDQEETPNGPARDGGIMPAVRSSSRPMLVVSTEQWYEGDDPGTMSVPRTRAMEPSAGENELAEGVAEASSRRRCRRLLTGDRDDAEEEEGGKFESGRREWRSCSWSCPAARGGGMGAIWPGLKELMTDIQRNGTTTTSSRTPITANSEGGVEEPANSAARGGYSGHRRRAEQVRGSWSWSVLLPPGSRWKLRQGDEYVARNSRRAQPTHRCSRRASARR